MIGEYIGKKHIWRKPNQYGGYVYIATENERPGVNDTCFVAYMEYNCYSVGEDSSIIDVIEETVSSFNIQRYHYVNTPLTIEAKSMCEFQIFRYNENTDNVEPFTSSNFYYRTSTNGEWIPYTSTNSIILNRGDIIQFKGDFTDHKNNMWFRTPGYITVYGNPLSILDSVNYATLDHFPNGDDDVYFIAFDLFQNISFGYGLGGGYYPKVSFPFDVSNVFSNLPA